MAMLNQDLISGTCRQSILNPQVWEQVKCLADDEIQFQQFSDSNCTIKGKDAVIIKSQECTFASNDLPYYLKLVISKAEEADTLPSLKFNEPNQNIDRCYIKNIELNGGYNTNYNQSHDNI